MQVTGTNYQDTNLNANTTYAYAVSAEDDAGNESARSLLSSATTPPPPPPQCSDSLDNDGDGLIDYPSDLGCTSATDNDETDPPTTTTNKFNIGDNATTMVDRAGVYTVPNGTQTLALRIGTQGTIVAGPQDTTNYTWYQVNYGSSRGTGWTIADELTKGEPSRKFTRPVPQ